MGKLSQVIRQAWQSLVSLDGDAYPSAQVSSNGKATQVARLSVYGICSNPPVDSHVVVLGSQGQEAVKFGIINDFLRRKKDLAEGEVALFNTLTGAYVYMKADGSIEVDAPGDVSVDAGGDVEVDAGGSVNATAAVAIVLTAPDIILNGNVAIPGGISGGGGSPIDAPDGITIGSLDLGTHVHDGVTTGAGNTGGPQ